MHGKSRKTPAQLLPAAHFIDERAAAAYLGMQVKTLQNWRWSGEGPPFAKFGAAVRYDMADLAAWAKRQVVKSTGDQKQVALA